MAITESNAWLNSQIMALLKIQMHFFFSSHVMLYVKFCIMVVSLGYYNDADYGVIRITIIMQMHIKDRIPDIVHRSLDLESIKQIFNSGLFWAAEKMQTAIYATF